MFETNPSPNGVAAAFWSTVTPPKLRPPPNCDIWVPRGTWYSPNWPRPDFSLEAIPPPIETPPIEIFGVRLCTNHASRKEGGSQLSKAPNVIPKAREFSFCFDMPSRRDFERSNKQRDPGGSRRIKKITELKCTGISTACHLRHPIQPRTGLTFWLPRATGSTPSLFLFMSYTNGGVSCNNPPVPPPGTPVTQFESVSWKNLRWIFLFYSLFLHATHLKPKCDESWYD